MNRLSFKAALACCAFGFFAISCEKESLVEPNDSSLQGPNAVNKVNVEAGATAPSSLRNLNVPEGIFIDDIQVRSLVEALRQNAVTPTECGPTPFNTAIVPYVMEFDSLEWEWYGLLSTINQLHTFIDDSPQYFGADGALTSFAAQNKRSLERFFGMPNEITLRGQHTSTLQNRDAIAAVYMQFAGASPAVAYANADFLIANVIEPSVAFDTTPLLSFDGFATFSNLIVIGDGIVQVLSDAGVEDKIVFAGILAHEWGHQVQFNNYEQWYGEWVSTPEATRLTELEADFFTGYYLTHKRGGTYNWKRAEQFFDLFYNIGDCGFESNGHHGTPLQRKAASYAGYRLAQETFPKGHILSADELHAIFMASLDDILANNVGL